MQAKIGILQGDYIGPEIIREAVKVLKVIENKFDYSFQYIYLEASGEAFDRYGEPMPAHTLVEGAKCDALLKGPFGGPPEELNHPKWACIEKGAILPLRKHYNLYTNIREVKVYPSLINLSPLKASYIEGTDIVIVRELTGGMYFGEKGERLENGERLYYDVEAYSESEIRRIAIKAFDIASKREKRKVTLVAKSNILKSSILWREIVEEVRKAYEHIEFNYMHVDNASMQLMLNPKQFDVILTSNMFGDILSDEASVLSGTIGLFPSASTGDGNFGLYEPIHGSAPDIAGKNIANPMSAILCLPLMFQYTFHDQNAAECVVRAVEEAFEEGYRTRDMFKEGDTNCILVGTSEMGDIVAQKISSQLTT